MSTEINLFNSKHAYSVQDCVSEDSDLVGCDAVCCASSSFRGNGSQCLHPQQQAVQKHSLGPKDEDTVILWNVCSFLCNHTASHPRTRESLCCTHLYFCNGKQSSIVWHVMLGTYHRFTILAIRNKCLKNVSITLFYNIFLIIQFHNYKNNFSTCHIYMILRILGQFFSCVTYETE